MRCDHCGFYFPRGGDAREVFVKEKGKIVCPCGIVWVLE